MVTFLFILTIILYQTTWWHFCLFFILLCKTTWWHSCLFLLYYYTRQHGDILVYSYYIIIQDNMVTFLFMLTILLYEDNMVTFLFILSILLYMTTWWHSCLFLQYYYTRQHDNILVYSYYIIIRDNMVTFLFLLTI